ncbi:MAG: FecR domain-containing protein [Pseudomonadota bacterium]
MNLFQPEARHAKAEAAAWVARLRGEDRSVEDELAFQDWLRADPANAGAFEVVNAMWDCTGSLPRVGIGAPAPEKRSINRRAVLASAFGAVFAGSGLLYMREAEAGVYQTDVGEQKHVSLSDGSQLLLDTDTKLKVRFDDRARAIDLKYGRVNCRIASDARRPFALDMGRETVMGQRSTFDVCRRGDDISVVLIQGFAAIKNKKATSKPRVLNVGERLIAPSDRQSKLDKPELVPLLAWQSGKAVFENSELREAVYEMNRYSNVKIRLADERLGHFKVSGIYRVGDNEIFARSLVKLLPVEARLYGDRIEIESDDDRMQKG